jgi:ATP-dependent Clp endopeptidase proteolytic subunit ClpP
MPADKDSIDRFFDYDIHVESRTVYLGDGDEGVDRLMAAKLIKAMHLLNVVDDAITILLNSFGGCWYNGLAIFDAIASSPCHVTAEVLGAAMSMGAVILQAADERVLHRHASLMLHDGFETRTGDIPKTFENWAEESKRSRRQMYRIFADRSGQPASYWERVCASDFILTAEEAKSEGLVDRIV